MSSMESRLSAPFCHACTTPLAYTLDCEATSMARFASQLARFASDNPVTQVILRP
jgi:hypothetical protein